MTALDWSVIAAYALGMIGLGWWVGRRQHSSEDYYLAGRRLGWFPIGVSTMATQLSAVSFISAPAFVALRPGGGLIWLGYEMAVPLAMIVLMAGLFPVFHSLRVVSVYEVLERRYDRRVRVVVSLVFQISRALAAGVMVYAASLVIAVTTGLPLSLTILLVGVVALVYELFGGIHVDILSDTIQMIVLLVGIVIVGAVALSAVGGWGAVREAVDPVRLQALDFSAHGLGDGRDYGFWPLLLGGFFLYLAYYGTDQSQVQRELAARSLDACKGSLLFNGLARFPVVLLYCTVGLVMAAWVASEPGFTANLPGGNIDYLVPVFVRDNLPPGLTGFVFVAILAAAMSSLDSAINSLSAATLEDIWRPLMRRPLTGRAAMRRSKILTLLWGVFCVGFAFLVDDISPTIIESINKIGSAFYGPVLAVFVTGLISNRVNPGKAIGGLVLGVALNLSLWFFAPGVSWLWWNLFGFVTAAAVMIVGRHPPRPGPAGAGLRARFEVPAEKEIWKRSWAGLALYALVIIGVLLLLPRLLG